MQAIRIQQSSRKHVTKPSIILSDQILHVLRVNNVEQLKSLIINSKLWSTISDEVFARLANLAEEANISSYQYKQLQKTMETLSQLDTELKCFTNILKDFQTSIPSEFPALVAKYRPLLNRRFFEHIERLSFIARNKKEFNQEKKLKIIGLKIAG